MCCCYSPLLLLLLAAAVGSVGGEDLEMIVDVVTELTLLLTAAVVAVWRVGRSGGDC